MADKKEQELTSVDKFLKYVVDHKNPLIFTGILIAIVLVALFIISFSVSSNRDKGLIKVAALEERVNQVEAKNAEFDSLIADLNALVKSDSYSSCKAAYLIGKAYFEVGEYANAYDNFMKAYELNKEIYLAPLALSNAAAAAENNGDADKAIDCFTLALDYEESGVKARALFNLGRIYLEKGNKELSKTYFELVVNENGYSEYAALAEDLLSVF